MRPVLNWMHKPSGGLWTSTYDPAYGSAWVVWCEAESWGVEARPGHTWLLHPSETARIYTVDSREDLVRLIDEVGYGKLRAEPGGPELPFEPMFFKYPNYEEMARRYDALHLTDEGRCATHLSLYPPNLWGWDAESLLSFRWIFDKVEEVDPSIVKRWGRKRGRR